MKKCTNCGATCQNGLMKGNGWIEFILWLCYIIPGLVYSIWRRSGEPSICPACKKDTLIPYIENVSNQSTNQRVEVECEWCAEPILANAKVCKHCGKEVNPQKVSASVISLNSITTEIPQSTTPVNNKIVTEKANKRALKFIGALIALIFIVNILKSNGNSENHQKIISAPIELTKADQSSYNKNMFSATTSDGLSKADLAWHAQNTYGWDCAEVISQGEMTKDGYFFIECSSGKKLRVYLRAGKHPKITNQNGTYK